MASGLYGERHGTGAFVRDVRFDADGSTVRASLEDDMHHFVVELTHDGHTVTSISGSPVRWPWVPCLDSPAALGVLAGEPLARTPVIVDTDVSAQCTHQFDLAVWAIGFAHSCATGTDNGAQHRRYLALVPDFEEPPFTAELWLNGHLYIALRTDGDSVLDGPWKDVSWRGGFLGWARSIDAADAEAAVVLRRTVWLAHARRFDLEALDFLHQTGLREGICHSAQPERMPVSFRNRGSLRDLSARANTLKR